MRGSALEGLNQPVAARADYEESMHALGDEEVIQRLVAVAPALAALLQGRHPVTVDKLRRDVALHSAAAGIDVARASPRQLRAARRGPRLGPGLTGLGNHRDLGLKEKFQEEIVSCDAGAPPWLPVPVPLFVGPPAWPRSRARRPWG